MTLMMLGFIPLLAGLISIVAQFVAETARVEMWENSGVNAIAKEVFNGIRIVIAYNGQEQESNRYAAKLEEAAGLGIRKSLLVAVGTALIYCLIFIAMAVTFWFGTLVSANGEITAGDVFATFWAIMGGIVAIGHAAKQIAPILAARKAIASVFEVIDHKPDANSVSMQFGTMDVVEGNIEFRNVHYSSPFEMATRLIDVNFEVSLLSLACPQ
ncbi:unnamed protein product [Toxocara canis]|uniref:ABC transmembrane type-1 domain-containing protein n=1 Tax=Toxocara canis TaxID=6265 RepID=A0A183U1C9_TOXCA|nr:unnamed protein product [Toxocara canis]